MRSVSDPLPLPGREDLTRERKGPGVRKGRSSRSPPVRPKGKVYLVGAGPGDAGLLTLRGAHLLGRADVVAYDHLVGRDVLALIPRGATRIEVGRLPGDRARRQGGTNRLLARHAQSGKVVVRLKGGDPFVLGRGAEEMEYLAKRGIACEMVPGVTSAIAVPGLAGIPVTHRDLASVVTIVTGHDAPGKKGPQVEWESLARPGSTIVVLMGVDRLAEITRRLERGGLAPETRAAVIERGSTPDQKVTLGTLRDIAERASKARAPAVLVVGPVVGLRSRIQSRPKRSPA